MPSAARGWPLVAVLVTAAALYVTRGVLDEIVVNGRPVRVALVPPWESLAGFLLLAAVGLLLVHAVNRRHTVAIRRAHTGELVLPLVALLVLLVPYLPILPDRLPVLQMLAGPARGLVWLVAGGLTSWVFWQHRVFTAEFLSSRTLSQASAIVAVATALLAGIASARLTNTALFPAGDEPHYLVIAQSLWRDGDLAIENNHQRGDYREYFAQSLDPHYLTRGSNGQIYSIHPIGLPVLLTPVYAAGGYRAVVWTLIAAASIAAALAWRWVAVAIGSRAAATFAVAVVVTSAPFLLNTFTVYPEIAAALAVMVALTSGHPLVVGIACGLLPWLSTKYAPMSLVLLLVSMPGPLTRRPIDLGDILKRVIPYGTMLLAWFAFFYAYWGSPWPQAPYGAMVQTSPRNLVFGAPGLLFDQEYGLLAYAPAYILGASGLWMLWRSGGERRLLAIRVALVFAALLGTVGAFRIWWGGAASPGRPLASGLLVLAMPVAAAFAAAPPGSARRAGQHLLLWIGLGVALTMIFAQEGLLIANGRDGTSSLLEWWSPRWEIWTLAPSFIHHEAPTAIAHSLLWLVVTALCAWALTRWPSRSPATSALGAWVVFAAGLLVVALTLPWLPADPPQPRVNPLARARMAALDSFDTRVRPAAIVFDPLRKTSSADLVSSFTLEVTPELRPDAAPLRVLHNGRFSLAAGTYRVDVTFADKATARPDQLALQVGRTGPALTTWPVDPAQESWSAEFQLPVDAGFVGFRGTTDLERDIRRIRLVPTSIVDAGRRAPVGQVLGSARYGDVVVLFHDDHTIAEPTGFWVLGRRPSVVSLAPDGSGSRAVIRLRAEHVANTVLLRAPGWTRELTLPAGGADEVELPAPARGVTHITIETSDGFVPVEHDPANRDQRFLGVWVEVTGAVH